MDPDTVDRPKRCAMDGYEFTGPACLAPVKYDQHTDQFTFENLSFCSLSCAKGWLFRDIHNNSARINLFTLYCTNKLHLKTIVDICPDPRFINEYMIDRAKGLTIQEFRNQNSKYVLSAAYAHINPAIDQSVYMQVTPTENTELDETEYTTGPNTT